MITVFVATDKESLTRETSKWRTIQTFFKILEKNLASPREFVHARPELSEFSLSGGKGGGNFVSGIPE